MRNCTHYSKNWFLLIILFAITSQKVTAQEQQYWVETDEDIIKVYETGLFSAKLSSGAFGNSINYGNVVVVREQTLLLLADPTFDFIPLINGGFITQSNVSIFEMFDANNRLIHTLSNSSGSALGEGISEWYTNQQQSLWVLTNPIIKTPQGEGSAASIWDGERTKNLLYTATDKIEAVGVSDNGLFVALVTASRANGEGKISVFDRQANALMDIEVDKDFEAIGIEFSIDNEYFTLFSSKRAIVYGLPSGKKYGSTSFRTTLIDVELDTTTLTLYALTGSVDDKSVINSEIRKVDFKASKMVKKEIEKDFTRVHSTLPVKLKYLGGDIIISGIKEAYTIN